MAVELSGGDAGGRGEIVRVGQGGAGKGCAPKDAPPACDEVEPGGADGNEGVLDARVECQPVANGPTEVAGKVVSNEEEIAAGRGLVECLQQGQIPGGVACGRRLGQPVAVAHAQCPVDPDLLESAVIAQRHLDAVAIHRPARSRREVAGRYGAEFVDADDRRARRRRGVERDDPGPFGTKSGSLLLAHSRVRRQRTPSRRKMRRTWLRATWTPRSWAAAVNVSRVHSCSACGSGAASSPVRS